MSILTKLGDGTGPTLKSTNPGSGEHAPESKIGWGSGTGAGGTYNPVADAVGSRLPVKVGEGLAADTIVAGQVTVTGSAAALPNQAGRRFTIRADPANGQNIIYIGPSGVSAANGFPLQAGDFLPFPLEVSNLNAIFAIASAGSPKLMYLGLV